MFTTKRNVNNGDGAGVLPLWCSSTEKAENNLVKEIISMMNNETNNRYVILLNWFQIIILLHI